MRFRNVYCGMIQGVYEFENGLDGYAYTGSSGNIEQRQKQHLYTLRNGRHHCVDFQAAWDKDGEDIFEFHILEVVEDPALLVAVEQKWIDRRIAEGKSYNTAQNAKSSMAGRKHTEKSRLKMSASQMGNQHWLGRNHTEESKQKISISLLGNQYGLGNQNGKGYKHTGEFKRQQSERKMGNQNCLGHILTEGHKQKIGASLTGELNHNWGKHLTKGTRLKIGAAMAKPYPAFIHRDTGEIIPAGVNLKRMCQGRGLHNGHMGSVKNGKLPHHKGWILLDAVQTQGGTE